MSRRTVSVTVNLPDQIVIVATWADRKVTGVYRTKKSIRALLRTKEVDPDAIFVEKKGVLTECEIAALRKARSAKPRNQS